jgi:hypothetical protein
MLTSVFTVLSKELIDLIANFTFWNLDIVLGRAVVGHKREEAILRNIELRGNLSQVTRPIILCYSCLQVGIPGDER